MDNSSVWLNFYQNMKNKIHHPSWKEHIKNSKSAKFGREMMKNAENIALQNLPFLYTFVLQAEICTTLTPKVVRIPLVIQKYTKLANFARLYFPHFSTFRDQILHIYYFWYALFSCCDGFCFSCFNKNLAKHWNCPLIAS